MAEARARAGHRGLARLLRPHGRLETTAVILGIVALACLGIGLAQPGQAVLDILQFPLALTQAGAATVLAVAAGRAAARASGASRWGWRALQATEATVATVLVVLIAAALTGLGGELPGTVQWTLFVLIYATAAAATLLLGPPTPGPTIARYAVDAAIMGLALFIMFWGAALRDLYTASTGEAWASALDVAYPFVDIMLIAIVLMVGAREAGPLTGRLPDWWLLFLAGMVVPALTDLAVAFVGLMGQRDAVEPLADTGGILGLLLVAIAALRSTSWAVGAQSRGRTGAYEWLPYPVVGLAGISCAWSIVEHGGLDLVVLVTLPVLLVAITVRSLLLVRDNRRLLLERERTAAERTHLVRFVSHELANPLSPLAVQARVLRTTTEPERVARGLDIVDRSISRLQRLSGDLRSLALAESGRLQLDLVPTDLASVAAEAVEANQEAAAEAGVTVGLDVRTAMVPAADRERIAQVVDNLLANALKFTPRGGKVLVRARPDEGGGGGRVEVTDTGAGLEPEQAQKLFQPFARVHGVQAPGLGLGLHLCRSILAAHGGRIGARSEGKGKGATFWFTVPGNGSQAQPAAAPPGPLADPHARGA